MTRAIEDLYRDAERQFAPAIRRLARTFERDREKARDLEQEIHCALWTSLARFRGDCALKTWVYRVAHNVAASHVEKAMRGPERVPLEDMESLPDAADPEGEAAERLVIARIAELVRRLPALDAQVIVLWLEGENAREIGEITGLSPGAVNVRVHRIKTLLADHFQPVANQEARS